MRKGEPYSLTERKDRVRVRVKAMVTSKGRVGGSARIWERVRASKAGGGTGWIYWMPLRHASR
jgi:hypothetical protein